MEIATLGEEILIDTPVVTVLGNVGGSVTRIASGPTGKKQQKKYASSKQTTCSECGAHTTLRISQTGDTACDLEKKGKPYYETKDSKGNYQN